MKIKINVEKLKNNSMKSVEKLYEVKQSVTATNDNSYNIVIDFKKFPIPIYDL